MRYTNDGSAYDRGYHGGHQDSEAARRGKADREAEAAAFRRMAAQPVPDSGSTSSVPRAVPRTSVPATFVGTVKTCALLGVLLSVGYAYLGLNATSLAALGSWAAKGLLGGLAAGLVLYAAVAILRVAVTVLAFVMKCAFWAAIALGVLYLLSR